MDIRLSRYGLASTHPSPVNEMMASVASDFRPGVDINLGVGYVNERTLPVTRLLEALHEVAADPVRYRMPFNYGGPSGAANLVASLRRFVEGRGTKLDGKRLIIGPCGATSILDALTEVLEPGIVVTSDPMYYIYSSTLERKGFEILAVPEDDEGIELEALQRKLAALGERAKEIAFFYTVTVNNPSCTILSNARRRALLHVAQALSHQQERRIPIFYDLAYELLLHDPKAEPFESVLGVDDLDVAYEIGTLSKVLAPGLRIGYLAGPSGALMNAMVQKTSDNGFNAPPFVQEMAGYMLEWHVEELLRHVNAGYREKAVAVSEAIRRELGPYVESCRGGSAGFYFYLTLREIETHPASALFRSLTAPGGAPRVLYIPGVYCVHPQGDLALAGRRQMRLSYGFEDTPQILHAISLMRQAMESVLAKS
jgi:2-aminoadipate transaminase